MTISETPAGRNAVRNAILKLLAVLVPLVGATTVYVEKRAASLNASISVTQQATARETATSSVAFVVLIEALEAQAMELEQLSGEVNRQREVLARLDERIECIRNPPKKVARRPVRDSDGDGIRIVEVQAAPPALPSPRPRVLRQRPVASEEAVKKLQEQYQEQVQGQQEAGW